MYNKKISIHFSSQNNYDGFIGGKIELRPFVLEQLFSLGLNKIGLKLKLY
jgi:hypothetical protein